MTNPKISVIIPVYNSERYLEKCLDSIINQTYRNLQIILIDDGSKDQSGEICDAYAVQDERITVIHQENGGVSNARNCGLNIADGDYYSFPDSDDYLETDAYEYLIQIAIKENCDIVNFEYYITYPHMEQLHIQNDIKFGMLSKNQSHIQIMSNEPFSWNKLYRKETIGDTLFRTDIFRGEDTLFAQTVTCNAQKIWFDKRALYHYVQSEQSACRGPFRPSQLTGLKLFDEYKRMFKEDAPDVWQECLCNALQLPITLYYDMYKDSMDYSNEMKLLKKCYKKQYQEVMRTASLTVKNKLKFVFFRYAPNGFCWLHKYIHRL